MGGSGKQILPPALQCRLQAPQRRDEYVEFAGLNFLNRPDIQVCCIGHGLLR